MSHPNPTPGGQHARSSVNAARELSEREGQSKKGKSRLDAGLLACHAGSISNECMRDRERTLSKLEMEMRREKNEITRRPRACALPLPRACVSRQLTTRCMRTAAPKLPARRNARQQPHGRARTRRPARRDASACEGAAAPRANHAWGTRAPSCLRQHASSSSHSGRRSARSGWTCP